jgi:hypothetical protein
VPPVAPALGDLPVGPGFLTPVLVLLAAVSVLEGYIWLDVIQVRQWRPSMVAFGVAVVGVTLVFARSRPGARAPLGLKTVVLASVALLVMTVAAVVVKRPAVADLAGAVDLLFALVAMTTVVSAEHLSRRKA